MTETAADRGRVRFSLLGPVEATRDGEALALGGPRGRALLALLLLHAGEVVLRERLVDGLWGDRPPGTAGNALQVAVHGLRRALGPARIETRGAGYVLRVEPGELDLLEFERLVREAEGRPGAEAAALLAEALALWRGEPLADVREAPFASAEVARLQELRLSAVERRIDADLEAGRHAELVPELERLVAGRPLREGLRRQLVLALYRAGRQADALEALREARRTLADELGLEPGRELRELERAVLRHDPALLPPQAAPPSVPLPLTSFVGRELELAAVTGLLGRSDVRLVTLTGPGGTGKTRLAVEAALRLAPGLADGAVFVDLAPLEEPDQVAPAIARALGADGAEPEALARGLRDRELLLVLDNFERVDAAAPLVTRLLESATALRVLATSRSALRVSGEHEYAVPALRVPAGEEARDPARLARNDAAALFVARARAARHDFRLTTETAGPVADICVALEGLPLALELAAARLRVLSAGELASRLTHRLPLLTGGPRDRPERQRTLRATIAWSHELLAPGERRLFAGLGVFAGGFDAEAAAAVCGATPEALEALAERSLLQRSTGGRYRMLETVREYALEQLEEGGEADAVRRLHAAHFRDVAERAGAALWDRVQGRQRAEWLERLALEHDNLRAALGWWELDGGDGLVRTAAALFDYWAIRGPLDEGRGWLERALARCPSAPAPARARALHATAFLALGQRDVEACDRLGEESLGLYRELGDLEGVGRTVHMLGQSAAAQDDGARALAYAEESLALARELEHVRGVIVSLAHLGTLATAGGEHERAEALLLEAAALAAAHEDDTALTSIRLAQAALARARGRWEEAAAHLGDGMAIAEAYDSTTTAAEFVQAAALVAGASGRPEHAARLFGAAAGLRAEAGIQGSEPGEEDEAVDRARAVLGDRFDEAWAEGRALTRGEALALARTWEE